MTADEALAKVASLYDDTESDTWKDEQKAAVQAEKKAVLAALGAPRRRLALHRRIDKFLAERRASGPGGGWAAITVQDIVDLDSIIRTLVTYKCAQDADGDRPVEWLLVNRRVEWLPRFRPLPYRHDEHNEDDYIDTALYNLMIATSEVQHVMDHVGGRAKRIAAAEAARKEKANAHA